MLQRLTLKPTYESERDDLLEDFYIPLLSESALYWRISAYFSASSLSLAAQGLEKFLTSDGRMQFILGNELSQNDFAQISEGYRLKEIALSSQQSLIEQIEQQDSPLFFRRILNVSKLIELGRLEIKVAYRPHGIGIPHKKIGLFFDVHGNGVSFEGSMNETSAALSSHINSESLSVFPNWKEGVQEYFHSHKEQFERYWYNNSEMTLVVPFEEAERNNLVKIISETVSNAASTHPEILDETITEEQLANRINGQKRLFEAPKIPAGFEIRQHQRDALTGWQGTGGGTGILALATGAGKTFTAIYGAVKLFENFGNLCCLISVPYQNLADQWIENLQKFNIEAIACFRSSNSWKSQLSAQILAFNSGALPFLCVVAVNKTMRTADFQNLIAQIPSSQKFLFIGDECHHHNTNTYRALLPQNAGLRLGLSATPFHYSDDEKNENLREYYGQIVASYSIEDAIKDGVLTPYEYHVVPVSLSIDETEQYLELSRQIAQLLQGSEEKRARNNSALKAVLLKRSRLLASAENKQFALKNLLRATPPTENTLFYCGDGWVDDESEGNSQAEEIKQIDAVVKIANEFGYMPSRFTAREGFKERQRIINNFGNGTIKSLVAIKCLDEGIDIPSCSTAFILASSSNPRQFIQRRGRILRRAPNKESARIYDFLVHLDSDALASENMLFGSGGENLMLSELKRVSEFARMSNNYTQVYATIRPLLLEYGLEGHL